MHVKELLQESKHSKSAISRANKLPSEQPIHALKCPFEAKTCKTPLWEPKHTSRCHLLGQNVHLSSLLGA